MKISTTKIKKHDFSRFFENISHEIFSKNIFQKIFFRKIQNLKISRFSKIFFPTKSCQKSLRIWEYLSLEKPSILAKNVFDFRPRNFFVYVEKCQNPLLIPYWNCGRNPFSGFWDLEQDPGICVSPRGASSMVKKYLEHAHQTLRILQLYHGHPPTEYKSRGEGARTLASPPNISNFATYAQIPLLFGKATEVAKSRGEGTRTLFRVE